MITKLKQTDVRKKIIQLWRKSHKKDRIRQVLGYRIRRIISRLDQDIKTRIPHAPLLAPAALLAATHKQVKFSQFDEDSLTNGAVIKSNDTDSDDDEEDTDEEDGESDPKKKVLIYVRVSTTEQKENGRSIASQIDELTAIVEDNPEMELYQEPIRDEGESGTDFDREGIQKVARLAQKDEITHVVVDAIDRIGRSVAETLMFIHELREKYGVNVMARKSELDVRKPTDRMRVTMLATMADFSTLNRARSALRSSASNFIDDKQWNSWFQNVPFGYEKNDECENDSEEWIQRVSKLSPVIEDIYTEFIRTENYTETADIVNKKHHGLLKESDRIEGDSLTYRQIKRIIDRPVYQGEPTIPVTDLQQYDPYPSVSDPSLQFIDEETNEQAQEIASKIREKYSTEEDQILDPNDYPDEFNPYMIESTSPIVQLVCPECSSDLIANGHQTQLGGGLGSRLYKCTNDNCEHERRWPRESEKEMMELLSEFNNLHSLV